MTLDELDLEPATHAVAQAIVARHPELADQFTSGRRGAIDQARAMAQNVIRNRRWIRDTYVSTPQSRMLQAWVDTHPQANQVQIEQAFAAAMATWTDAAKAALSKHFSGQAFDLRPMAPGAHADKVIADIHATPGVKKFLTMEGGLPRWHVQTA